MKKIILLILTTNLLLSSCSKVRESAGATRKNIDEYSVIENPPLVIPPDFNLLPPEQIETKNIDNTESELAKEILFGLDDEVITDKDDSSLINIIINETKADQVNPNIRQIIDEEYSDEKSSVNNNKKKEEDIEVDQEKKSITEDKTKDKKKKKKRFFFF